MPTETTYARLRKELAATLDHVADDQEVVIVRRRGRPAGSKDVALVPAQELAGWMETAHLLRSDRNAKRLLRALRQAERGSGKPATVASPRREFKREDDR